MTARARRPPGRRELKRREVTHALHNAALDLAVTDGFKACVVEDIARRTNTSPRTFFNYFPAKEDAILGIVPAAMPDPHDAAAILAAPLSGEDSAIRAAGWLRKTLTTAFLDTDDPRGVAKASRLDASIRRRILGVFDDIELACRTTIRATALPEHRGDADALVAVAAAALRFALTTPPLDESERAMWDQEHCEDRMRAFLRAATSV